MPTLRNGNITERKDETLAAKLTRIATGSVVALSATALLSVAAAVTASAAPRAGDLLLDAQATITQTTMTANMAAGASYAEYASVTDNASGTKGDASSQCSVAGKDNRCLTILRLPGGEITFDSLFTPTYPATYKGAVLGGTGAFKDITGEADMTRPDAK